MLYLGIALFALAPKPAIHELQAGSGPMATPGPSPRFPGLPCDAAPATCVTMCAQQFGHCIGPDGALLGAIPGCADAAVTCAPCMPFVHCLDRSMPPMNPNPTPGPTPGAGGADNGEALCEGHNFSPVACGAIGCCQWDNGCWSNVGQDSCAANQNQGPMPVHPVADMPCDSVPPRCIGGCLPFSHCLLAPDDTCHQVPDYCVTECLGWLHCATDPTMGGAGQGTGGAAPAPPMGTDHTTNNNNGYQPAPQAPPTGNQGEMMVSGPCAVVDNGMCVTSGGFPAAYGNNERCTITVPPGMEVYSEVFKTERNYDKMLIDGVDYHGEDGPDGIVAHGPIEWSSDYSVSGDGWKVCARPAVAQPDDQSPVRVMRGPCTVSADGMCARSPNYPAAYGNNERCLIKFEAGLAVSAVEKFTTERNWDKMVINGVDYHGQMGQRGAVVPIGVVPHDGMVHWRSDGSVTGDGWQICGAKAAPTTSLAAKAKLIKAEKAANLKAQPR